MNIADVAAGAAALKAGLESMKMALQMMPPGAPRDQLARKIAETEASLREAEGAVAIGRNAVAMTGGVALGDGARAGPGGVSIGPNAGPRGG